jgi:hypothetical protein
MLLSEWRVASEHEEIACKQKDIDEARAKAKRNYNDAAMTTMQTFKAASDVILQQAKG